MDLIVSHKNADFDALSSVVAAKKLYPGARILLPGSQEKSVRNFLSLFKDKIRLEDEKTCRLDDVTRLVIVDNRHRSRIGIAGDLLDRKGIRVHIYDHHPRTRYDIKADRDVFKEVGATVSILLEMLLKKRRFDLTPLEATLMLLGIYEETGSLSYRTTKKLDVDIVSKLLEKGANLNAVSSYLNRELDTDELRALVDLLGAIEVEDLGNIKAAFAGVNVSDFSGETGTVVHKLQDVENYPVIFAMFQAGDRVKVLARSRIELVDVNRLLSPFGGAGHSSAASANFSGKTFAEVKAAILGELARHVRPEARAADLMSVPVWSVFQEEKVGDVLKKMRKKGFDGAPVIDDGGDVVGIISTGNLKKAISRGMGHSRIKGYMDMNPVIAAPDTPLYELRNTVREKDKGVIPVIRDGKVIGVVTRTDILKKVHGTLFSGRRKKEEVVTYGFPRMRQALPRKLVQIIKDIGGSGDAAGMGIFLVGGFVRDFILGRKNYDLDIVVEGDAIKFAATLKDKMGGSLVVHRKFGTATLVKDWPAWLGPSLHPDNKFKIDIATARKEKYRRPAALPDVRFSSLQQDLYRRDFTINAMAIKVNSKDFGRFVDFFGGMKDLKAGVIRTLHDKSFIDDPTRIFRAVRFEQRFGFTIEKHTEYLIQHAIKQEMFRRTENQRIREELVLMLKEDDPARALYRMKELHELRFVHPSLVLRRSTRSLLRSVRRSVKWYEKHALRARRPAVWIMNLMVMLESLDAAAAGEVMMKFVFPNNVASRVLSFKDSERTVRDRLSARRALAPSAVYRVLEPLPHEVTLCILAKTRSALAEKRIKKFFTDYNGMQLRVHGHDIQKEGVPPGPRYKDILRQVLYEKLDGNLRTRRDELRYMKKIIRKTA